MPVRFHLDEHVDDAIASALRRRGIDVTTTMDAGLQSATDLEHIAFAREQRRVIHTNDPDSSPTPLPASHMRVLPSAALAPAQWDRSSNTCS
jgi:predicted nuclease of predicted toxin-antitoxin system